MLWPCLVGFARLLICILDFGLVLMDGVITKQWVSNKIGDIEMACWDVPKKRAKKCIMPQITLLPKIYPCVP